MRGGSGSIVTSDSLTVDYRPQLLGAAARCAHALLRSNRRIDTFAIPLCRRDVRSRCDKLTTQKPILAIAADLAAIGPWFPPPLVAGHVGGVRPCHSSVHRRAPASAPNTGPLQWERCAC